MGATPLLIEQPPQRVAFKNIHCPSRMKGSRYYSANAYSLCYHLHLYPSHLQHACCQHKTARSPPQDGKPVPENAARASLRLRPLAWDARLERYAQSYANQRRYDCDLKHSNGPYGENIFWGSGSGWTPAQAAAAWVSERRWYTYWSNSCAEDQECGHYTQIVWNNTERMGCARVDCFRGRGVFMTCNYDPPGNFIGEKPY